MRVTSSSVTVRNTHGPDALRPMPIISRSILLRHKLHCLSACQSLYTARCSWMTSLLMSPQPVESLVYIVSTKCAWINSNPSHLPQPQRCLYSQKNPHYKFTKTHATILDSSLITLPRSSAFQFLTHIAVTEVAFFGNSSPFGHLIAI